MKKADFAPLIFSFITGSIALLIFAFLILNILYYTGFDIESPVKEMHSKSTTPTFDFYLIVFALLPLGSILTLTMGGLSFLSTKSRNHKTDPTYTSDHITDIQPLLDAFNKHADFLNTNLTITTSARTANSIPLTSYSTVIHIENIVNKYTVLNDLLINYLRNSFPRTTKCILKNDLDKLKQLAPNAIHALNFWQNKRNLMPHEKLLPEGLQKIKPSSR